MTKAVDFPVLFSTNSWLAWAICQRYYGGRHYVWVSPFFAPEDAPDEFVTPPSSTPAMIFQRFLEDIRNKDYDSKAVRVNRMGIRRGAEERFKQGDISEETRDFIFSLVDESELTDFLPRIYAIPTYSVQDQLNEPKKKAHPLSEEWIIENLSDGLFGVVDFRNRL